MGTLRFAHPTSLVLMVIITVETATWPKGRSGHQPASFGVRGQSGAPDGIHGCLNGRCWPGSGGAVCSARAAATALWFGSLGNQSGVGLVPADNSGATSQSWENTRSLEIPDCRRTLGGCRKSPSLSFATSESGHGDVPVLSFSTADRC